MREGASGPPGAALSPGRWRTVVGADVEVLHGHPDELAADLEGHVIWLLAGSFTAVRCGATGDECGCRALRLARLLTLPTTRGVATLA